MYVAVATASRAAEEAAPVPAERANTPETFDLFIDARLSCRRPSIFLLVCPFEPFVKLQSYPRQTSLCGIGYDGVPESEINDRSLNLITRE